MADYEPRGRIDLRRDSDLYRMRIQQQRVENERYPPEATAREDVEKEFVRREVHTKLSDVQKFVKIAAITTGAFVVAKTMGPERIIKSLSAAGTAGYKLRDRVIRPVRHMMEDTILGMTGQARSIARNFLGASSGTIHVDPDIVEELQNIYSKYSSLGSGALKWLHGPNQTGVDLHRRWLTERYAGKRTLQSGLSRVTVGDLLNRQDIRQRFSENAYEVLSRAHKMGLVDEKMGLSTDGIAGFFFDQKGRFLDTQWANPLRIFDAAHQTFRGFKIGGFSPADFLFGGIRPLVAPGHHLTLGNNMRLPNGIKTGPNLTLTLGQDVYTLASNRPVFNKIGSGFNMWDISRQGGYSYARAIAAAEGKLAREFNEGLNQRMVPPDIQPGRNFLQQVQRLVGVGPEFQTHRHIGLQILDFFRRRRGSSRFVPNQFVPAQSTLNIPQKMAERVLAEEIPEKLRVPGMMTGHRYAEAHMRRAVRHGVKNIDDLSFIEQLKVYAGKSRAGNIFISPPTKNFRGKLYGEALNPPRPMQGFTSRGFMDPLPVGPGGKPTSAIPATGVADKPGFFRAFNVVMHHMTERLNQLIGYTANIGFRPTSGELGWIGNIAKIYGTFAAGAMGVDALKYTDYLSGEFFALNPFTDDKTISERGVKAYSEIMVARQKLREGLGIQQGAEYLEGLMPGSMTLPGSYVARTIAPVAVGLFRGGRVGGVMGGLASMAFGGTDPHMSSAELEAIYEGRKKVPIMKNRWWVMGLQPWSGDEISHFDYHWTHKYLSNYRYTDVQFGSKSEYFSYQSPLPTPHNLFGLKRILNPDHYTEKHYFTRPYPYAPSGVEMHAGEEFISPPDAGAYEARELGFDASPGTYTRGIDPTIFTSKLRRLTDHVTEMGGIYKFLAEQLPFYDDIVGTARPSDKYAASADTITSFSRMFYDENLGGLLGQTELFRRFLDPDKGRQGINLIPNQMPDWLPGNRSAFLGDRDHYVDYSLGDPYAKIPRGEGRLPGPGYEALNRLHSGVAGRYDPMDQYLILADVAPYSQAFQHYRTIVQGWAASGALDRFWTEKYLQTEEEVRQVVSGPVYTPRIFSGVKSGTIEEVARASEYSAAERLIGASWETLTHDVVPTIGKTIPIFGTILDRKLIGQRSAYESYMESQVYGTDFHDWTKPYSSFIRPRATSLTASDPLTATFGGAAIGSLFGATPGGFAVGLMAGAGFGLASTGRALATGKISGGWLPSEYQERTELQEYFDALEYEKYSRLEAIAREQGRSQLADKYKSSQERTAVGTRYDMDSLEFMNSAKFRMGHSMKDYAWQFMQAPESSRSSIMEVAPSMARPLLASAWRRQGDLRYQMAPRESVRDRAAGIISQHGLPDHDWLGWSPEISMRSIKVKTLDSHRNIAYDYHKHNIWEHDRRTTYINHPRLTSAF